MAYKLYYILAMSILATTKAVSERQGTVLFMKAGDNVTVSEMFYNSTYNDYKNPTKHLWNITDLMNGTNFRSPILDRKGDLNLTSYEAIAYNAVGEIMTSFSFTMVSGSDPVTDDGNITFLDQSQLSSPVVYSPDDGSQVRFLSINIQSSVPTGVQFILTTDETFRDLPDAAIGDCLRFTASLLFTNVNATFLIFTGDECTEYCTTKAGSKYAIAFSANENNKLVHRCTCLANLGTASSTSLLTDIKCPDGTECGCSDYNNGDTYVYGTTYYMANINNFLSDLTTTSAVVRGFDVYDNSPYISFSTRSFVTKVRVDGLPSVTYKLGFYEGYAPCDSVNYTYYGEGLGEEVIFNATKEESIEATPADCLKLDFLTHSETLFYVDVTSLTDVFVTASYFRLVGHWTNLECQPEEVLHNSTRIPDTWVHITQTNQSLSVYTYGNSVEFPEMSAGTVRIISPYHSSKYYLLRFIDLTSNADVVVKTILKTNNTCVEEGTGNLTLQTFFYTSYANLTAHANVTTVPLPTKCAYNITFVMNTTQPSGNLSPRVNQVNFTLRGCVIYESSLDSPCNTFDITDLLLSEANVGRFWVPHRVRAVTYLRPGGPGLIFHRFAEVFITIQLDEKWIPLTVKRVFITGDVIMADITIDGVRQSVHNNSAPVLDYMPNNLKGHMVTIDHLIGRNDISTSDPNYLYQVINIAIEICSLALNSINKTAGAVTSAMATMNTSTPIPSTNATSHSINTATPITAPNINTTTTPINVTSSGTPNINTTQPTNVTTPIFTPNTSTTPPLNVTVSGSHNTNATTPTINVTTPIVTPNSNTTPPINVTSSSIPSTNATQPTNVSTPVFTPNTSTTPPLNVTSSGSPNTNATTPTINATTPIVTPNISAVPQSTNVTTPNGTNITNATTTITSIVTTITQTQPVTTTTQTQPETTTTQLVTTITQPVTTATQPITATSQPVTMTTQPVNTTTQPVTTTTQPVTTTIQGVITTTQPVTTTTQPVTTTTQPVTTTTQPVTTTTQPVTTTTQPVTTTTQPVTTATQPVTTTTLPISTTTQTQPVSTKAQTQPVTTSTVSGTIGTSTAPPKTGCCLCFSNTVNMTQEEVEELVDQLVRNLTVPRRKTSAYKRTLESAPDERTSAKVVGSVGIAMMTMSGVIIVALDYTHIVAVLKFVKHLITSLL